MKDLGELREKLAKLFARVTFGGDLPGTVGYIVNRELADEAIALMREEFEKRPVCSELGAERKEAMNAELRRYRQEGVDR